MQLNPTVLRFGPERRGSLAHQNTKSRYPRYPVTELNHSSLLFF